MWICHLLQMFRCFTPRNIYVHLFSELKGDEVHPEIKISHHHVQLLVPLHLWSGLSGDDLPALSWSSALSDLQSWAVAESTIQVHVWAQSIIAGVVWHQPVISDDRRQIEHDKIIFPLSRVSRPLFLRQTLTHLSFFYGILHIRFRLQAPSILLFTN